MWIISFWIFPVISAFMWIAMLLAMLGSWAAQGSPVYPSMEKGQTIAYISDIGAQGLKPLFIAGSVITVVFLDLSFISERWLRHAGQLVPNKGRLDKACAILSIFFSIAGALGLILLSIFDTLRHPDMHDGFLVMFLVGYIISAILICAEYLRLGIFYRSQHRVLFASFVIKLLFIVIEIALAIAFAVLGKKGPSKRNAAAVLEWVIALIFTFYVLSFVVDLLPSVRTRRHVPQGEKRIARSEMENGMAQPNATIEEPLTTDSAGPNVDYNYYRGQRM
ncbi:Frag1/DRAM/Sfk1 family-domain-containing protein [Aspergillus bertholletiae]|uniref:Frag1/DRAM/Sfk1 family-domain-containing protein n=1 Tax=Aspergillus bertholletiae TaxID=1226010 RepID=A0A5N7B402_9EURO|nr:Frag1/DRAM/Sfk1 family-domain-containing protein [Aspergillus bertholletiae]